MLNGGFIRRFKGCVGYGVKTDQIDAATNSVKYSGKLIYMGRRIIESFEENVFKGDPALTTKVP